MMEKPRAIQKSIRHMACGIGGDICQTEAITLEDMAVVNLDRCIGCGLCATACAFDAVKLIRQDQADQWTQQADYLGAVMVIHRKRRDS